MSQDTPKVSLVVNVYNSEGTLREALDSAVSQTLKDMEIICVDDGSKDSTLAIAGEYQKRHPNFRILALPENKGTLNARREGVLAAHGQYIMFLDGDDLLLPEACEELSAMMDDKKVDFIQFGIDLLSSRPDTIIPPHLAAICSIKYTGPIAGSANIMDSAFRKQWFSWTVWSKIFSVELARKTYRIVPTDTCNSISEDLVANFLVSSMATNIFVISKSYYRYRIDSGISTVPTKNMHSLQKRFESQADAYLYMCDYTEKNFSPRLFQSLHALNSYLSSEYFIARKQNISREWICSMLLRKAARYGNGPVIRIFNVLCLSDDKLSNLLMKASKKSMSAFNISSAVLRSCQSDSRKNVKQPSAEFDPQHYYAANPDVYYAGTDPLTHYLNYGKKEGRRLYSEELAVIQNSKFFDTDAYCREHGEELGRLSPEAHYILIGQHKKYATSSQFDSEAYSRFHFDIEKSSLFHHLLHGMQEGRCTFPFNGRFEFCYPDNFDAEKFESLRGRILIAVPHLDYSASSILAMRTAGFFSKSGTAAIISPSDGPLRNECLRTGIPVIIDSNFFVREERVRAYREKGYVFALFSGIRLLSSYLQTAAQIPSILWIHEIFSNYEIRIPVELREKITDSPSVFASSEAAAFAAGEWINRIHFLPPPASAPEKNTRSYPEGTFRFGLFGQYTEKNGQELAIEAYLALPAELKQRAELLLIGNPARQEYAELLKEYASKEPSIKFVAPPENLQEFQKLLAGINTLICLPGTEWAPVAMIDGMGFGCPVILVEQGGGTSKEIQTIENGFVSPAGNPHTLSECMQKIMERPVYEKLTKNIRENLKYASGHPDTEETLQKIIRKMARLYPYLGA